MTERARVLVAGATGYLGNYLVRELKRQGYWVRALSRDVQKIEPVKEYVDDVFVGEATQPASLAGICSNIDIVISSLGITRQRDGLSYMDVDYQGNRNLLDEARRDQVSGFMYISVFNADHLRHLEIVKAKERFANELRQADLDHVIVRPNGFFSDMTEFFEMARKGRVYLFGNGEFRANPIHGEDLARACVERLETDESEWDIGGPEILTQNELARLAFKALGKPAKISKVPLWVSKLIVTLCRRLTPSRIYGPIEFFMAVLTMDMVAPTYGSHCIEEYFRSLSRKGCD